MYSKVSEYLTEAEKDREMETFPQLPRQKSAIEIPIQSESSGISVTNFLLVFVKIAFHVSAFSRDKKGYRVIVFVTR